MCTNGEDKSDKLNVFTFLNHHSVCIKSIFKKTQNELA